MIQSRPNGMDAATAASQNQEPQTHRDGTLRAVGSGVANIVAANRAGTTFSTTVSERLPRGKNGWGNCGRPEPLPEKAGHWSGFGVLRRCYPCLKYRRRNNGAERPKPVIRVKDGCKNCGKAEPDPEDKKALRNWHSFGDARRAPPCREYVRYHKKERPREKW